MRLFVAVHLNESTKYKIKKLISQLKEKSNKIKWVPIENLHITLKFLGETDESMFGDVISSLEKIKHSPFTLTIAHIGGFPNLKSPKVLWIGIQGDQYSIKSLSDQVEKSIIHLNYTKEQRKFTSHITIGRVKQKIDQSLLNYLIENQTYYFGEVTISSFSLIESQLTSKGAVYNELHHFPLVV